MADYFGIKGNEKYKKKEIEQVEHKSLYNDCFLNTAKLWKDYNSNEDLIKAIDFGRAFYKSGKPAYFEIFEEPRTKIMGFSKKISLIYAPLENDTDKYDKRKCIGFRFYEKINFEKCNYFTLVVKYDKKFFILEKDKTILDFDGKTFYDENLNCYSVMRNIIFEKYKNDIVTPRGEVFPEIFGFIYSLISLGKSKGFKVVEPLILDPLNKESLIEQLPEILEENIGYIEPIIFDNHISVTLIKKGPYKDRERTNAVIDMSRYHVEENISDNTLFPEELNLNNYPYPDFSIQKGNSCGLWFYGIIECIYTNKRYNYIDDVYSAIQHSNTDFFIDVINCLSNHLYGISDIIDNSSLENSLTIKENRIYEAGQLSIHSFRNEAAMSYFFSLASLFAYYETKSDNYNEKFHGIELLCEYQYLIDNIQSFLSLVVFNDNYFKIFSSKEIYETDQKNEYFKLTERLKAFLDKVIQNYIKEFNNALYAQFEDNLNYGKLKIKGKLKKAYSELIKKISKNEKGTITDINKLKKEFETLKHYNRKVVIREESTIAKYLNPNGEYYFQMMIH